ncbi:MAG: cupin domain-containing protein [Desulfomicrobium sp.]
MKKHTRFLLAALSFALLLQSGCASLPKQQAPQAAVVQELAKATTSWDGSRLPLYPQGQPEITILRIAIPAGTRLKTHLHPVINAGVLLSGQLTVVAQDGKTLILKAGDPIVELVNTAHYGVNEGDEPAEIIVFYAGTSGAPITVSQTK